MKDNNDTHIVELRDRDVRNLIKVLRFHTGDYQSINNVSDEDVGFIVDTLIEARGEDLNKPVRPPTGEEIETANRNRKRDVMRDVLRKEAAESEAAKNLLDRLYGVGGDPINLDEILNSPQTPEQRRLADIARERLDE